MFDESKEKGQAAGEFVNKGLTNIGKFVILYCLLHPICHVSNFLTGFSAGFSKKKHIVGKTY